ncbi:hypothetical protein SG34_001205 [Thalassomonas viridans]|uniref:Thioredoxin domain-containing protein n=1 Tax=Thalassomonas viridans TaxID=137584 RepID=A0AAF0C9B3_9GAMM|nr:hypothetical protein [Thalassomonas viridans]WDE05593.1 hypothetical protein SG34_001205 [Thalassomonas viridans]
MGASEQKKSRRSFIYVCSAFIIPIVLAKLALENNWFNYGVTNRGQLLEAGLTLEQLGLSKQDFDRNWLILYRLPKECELQCQRTLASVNNTYTALGKEMPRVKPVALIFDALTVEQLAAIQPKRWHIQPIPGLARNLIKEPQIFIVDPLGNLVLSHAPPKESKDLPVFGKSILADLQKLLKYSRIG